MIIFVPAYDEATHANLSVALAVADNSLQLFFKEDALGARLKAHLKDSPAPLFVMSHGASEYFFDQNDEPAILLEEVHLLSNLPVFVFACYTANEFGKTAAQGNSIFWGYTGAIQSLDSQPAVSIHFQPIFKSILQSFSHLSLNSEIAIFLASLRDICEQANNKLDEIWESNPNLDLYAAYNCLSHLWGRLRVYHPDLSEPILHPDAPIGDLFE